MEDQNLGKPLSHPPPQITALAAGKLEENAERDTLLVGSQTNLLAYDVEKNADVFYKVNLANYDGCIL